MHLFFFRISSELSILLAFDKSHRGLPLITYAPRGGGGVGGSTLMHTNAYKGGGGV